MWLLVKRDVGGPRVDLTLRGDGRRWPASAVDCPIPEERDCPVRGSRSPASVPVSQDRQHRYDCTVRS